MADFDYNYNNDHEEDGSMSSLLSSYPREFVRPPSNAIAIFGADYKAKAGCGRDVAMSDTGLQFVRTIVAEEHDTSASDNNLNTEHVIP